METEGVTVAVWQ